MYQFEVKGMSCQHCRQAITDAVQDIDSKAQVKVDIAKGKVTVKSSTTLEEVASAIVDAGYDVIKSQSLPV